MPIRLLLAQHRALIRDGIVRMLEPEVDMEIVATASQMQDAQRLLRTYTVDAAIIDTALPPAGALEAVHRFKRSYPELKLLGIGATAHGPYPALLLQNGMHGFVTHDSSTQDLTKAVRQVAEGNQFVSGDAAQRILLNDLSRRVSAVSTLSARELSVIVMVAKGLRPQEIAKALSISPKTVSTYRSRACKKLGVKTDVELTHISLKHGLIEA